MREAAAFIEEQRARRRRGRATFLAIGIAAAALAGGCGGDDAPSEPPPALAQRVGKTLSDRASEIAKRLEDGRRCAAADDVRELREVVERQAANDRIPEELREPLLTGVDALLGRIDCVERVTETVTVPAEPEIVTTTATEAPEEDEEGSGGSEAAPEENPGSGDSGSGGEGGPVPTGQEQGSGGGGD
jgi:hypothetical protein